MKPVALLRLALAGSRTDTARVALTAGAAALATLAMLSALTVLAIQPSSGAVPGGISSDQTPAGWARQYSNNLLVEPGLRPGVAIALLLLCIPVLALAGQSARLGAPARDRRLAAVRLAGATPRQAVTVAVTETGLAAALGAAAGIGLYFGGRALLHRPDAQGQLPLPTDQLPSVPGFLIVGLGLPVLAAAAAALLLRRVGHTPFGVVRRERTRPPRPWPGVLIVLGVAAFAGIAPLTQALTRAGVTVPDFLLPALLGAGALLAMLGVVLGTGWLAYATGRVLHRFARGPAALLAARRLLADPWSGSRTLAALLACVMVGAGAAGVRAWFSAQRAADRAASRAGAEMRGETPMDFSGHDDFYFRTLELVNAAVGVAAVIAALGLLVFLVEGIVSRRRTYTALVATGVPRRTLARTLSWQVLGPAVPAIALALAVGVTLPRAISRQESGGGYPMTVCTADDPSLCGSADSPHLEMVQIPTFVRPVELPVAELALVGGGALGAVLVTVAAARLFLRASTEVSELRTT